MKITLLLILVLGSLTAWSAPKHIVFNLDGTLIQGIPSYRFEEFTNKDQMFSTTLNGQTRYYYVYPFASQLLSALQSRKDILIHVVSKYTKVDTDNILAKIKLAAPYKGTLGTLFKEEPGHFSLAKEDLVDNKINLSKITTDLKNIVLLTSYPDIVQPEYKSNEVSIGKPYYYFEKYEQASAELARKPTLKDSIPASQEEWNLSQQKLAYSWQVLLYAEVFQTDDLVTKVLALKPNRVEWTKTGVEWAYAGFKEFAPKWKFSKDMLSVTGCGEYSITKKTFGKELTFQDCLDLYGTKFTFKLNEKLKTVEGCEERDESTSAFIQATALGDCLDQSKDQIKYYWKGKQKTQCLSYYNNSYLVAVEANKSCGDDHVLTEAGALRFVSLYFDGTSFAEFIPGIMKLSVGQTIDAEIYQKNESVHIARSLIKFIEQTREQDNSKVSKPNYDFYQNTRIMMALNFQYFDSVTTKGFLNQHLTKSSNGSYSPTSRASVEDSFVGLTLERNYDSIGKAAHDVRPKYSYLLLDAPHNGMGETTIYPHYGNVFFKFKDSLKNRSTFTGGDSLSMPGQNKTFYFRSTDRFKMTGAGYWETQIWGKLTLDDVEYVVVNCPSVTPLSTKQIEVIKDAKLRVYLCQAVTSGSDVINISKGSEL